MPSHAYGSHARALKAAKLFELLAFMTIGASLWQIGDELQVFHVLNHYFKLHNGLTNLALLSAFIAAGAAIAVARTSAQLRRAIAARIAAEAAAERAARQDPLTGLGNRRHFLEQFEAKLAARAPGQVLAVIAIDLDRFKPVNDVHGHAAGNAVLCAVARRLDEQAPPGSVVARLGGDEFVILLLDGANEAELGRIAQNLIVAIGRPIPWRHGFVDVDATLGVARVMPGASDAEAALHAADVAMYQGKRQGRGVWRLFRDEMHAALKSRAQLEIDLREAIAADAVAPHYQPIVALPGRETIGFEVLARWTHPRLGPIPPQTFIPLAEESGLICDLFLRLLRTACVDAREWPGHLRLSVNLSPLQLQDPRLPSKILAVLTQTRFPAERLEVEITEAALVGDSDSPRIVLTSLKNLGVQLALDDFGASPSTLLHLSQLRFNKLKIDRSYVTGLKPGDDSARMIDAILRLGSSLSVQATAAGVESEDNVGWLFEQGCAYAQGYLFGRAMPKSEVAGYLTREYPAAAPGGGPPRLVARRRG